MASENVEEMCCFSMRFCIFILSQGMYPCSILSMKTKLSNTRKRAERNCIRQIAIFFFYGGMLYSVNVII